MQYVNPYIELCLEGSSSIFKKLNQKEKEFIAGSHKLIFAGKGDHIFKEGEKTRGAIFLASGKIKLYKVGAGGREQILKMVKKGETIGYTSLLAEKNWSFSSGAMTDSVLCILDKNTLVNIMKKNSDLSLKLIELLSEELLNSYNRTISLTQKHVRARLAESLLILAGAYGYEDDGKTLTASLSRDDLAHFSNMTTSNAIRTLSNFASEGIIKINRRRISIPDPALLEEISKTG
jgi:CRP/FNR family transcriptional regulator, polysaccharide utilization system transcription regulator